MCFYISNDNIKPICICNLRIFEHVIRFSDTGAHAEEDFQLPPLLFGLFGLNAERLARCKKDVLVMHPGPINRGVEITSEVADGPHSAILQQVANGVAIRMAVMYLVAGTKSS